jgi:hypothetical protein
VKLLFTKITKLAANEDPYPDLLAKFTSYEEPLVGNGNSTQRKASSFNIDTQNELSAAHMMIAKAEFEKVNLAKEREAYEQCSDLKEQDKEMVLLQKAFRKMSEKG